MDNREDELLLADVDLLPIVGVGASAGGLKSIEAFFGPMPVDTGLVFVVVQHLSPNHKSLMREILARHTRMPVEVVTDDVEMQPNRIYLIPPGKELRCTEYNLELSDLPSGLSRPIDTLFKSLAVRDGAATVGVVLSGTGSDGSEGIIAIQRAGGMTLAESTATAEFDGMPVNAARTGSVHQILPPEEMAEAICRFRSHRIFAEQEVGRDEGSLRSIFVLLAKKYQLHFEQYKSRTITNRIERRRLLGGFQTISEYTQFLENSSKELDSLYHDLLIGVTRFFRDPEAFKELAEVVTKQLQSLPDDETYRVWVAACATGEEAYSIAMLVLDALASNGRAPRLKIFATDVHQGSLEKASRGEFGAEAMQFVSTERRLKYFDELDDGRYRVKQKLRKHLVFAYHNAVRDPHFSGVHLACCRNVLIYLVGETQKVVLRSLHTALTADGLLFLGTSESLGECSSLFQVLNRKWRIFQKCLDGTGGQDGLIQVRDNVPSQQRRTTVWDTSVSRPIRGILEVYDALILSQISLGLLLDERQNVVHFIGDGAAILKGISERFRGTIGEVMDAPARTSIAVAMIRAQRDPGTSHLLEQVQPNLDSPDVFDVRVMALRDLRESNVGWFIQFEAVDKEPDRVVRVTHKADDAHEMLESELQFTKESLNALVEELEVSNEELQATNEEMVASNEELQSTNEELQSVNEELHSVNAELHRKIQELEEATSDLETFLGSSDIGTVFLDQNLRVRRFTRSVTRHFSLLEQDVGRKLTDFSSRLGLADFPSLLQQVVETGNAYASICVDEYDATVYVNMVPHRFGNDTAGVVVTILSRAHLISKSAPLIAYGEVGTWEWPDMTSDRMWWSPTCYRLLGLNPSMPALFSAWRKLIHPDDRTQLDGIGGQTCRFVREGLIQVRMQCGDGDYHWFEFRNICQLSEDSEVHAMAGTVSRESVIEARESDQLHRIQQLEQTVVDSHSFVDAVANELQASMEDVRNEIESLDNSIEGRRSVRLRTQTVDRTLGGLVEYSRYHSAPMKMRPCDMDAIVADVLNEFAGRVAEAGASVIHLPLPEMFGDADQLRALVWHVIDNALKYSGIDPPNIRIEPEHGGRNTTIVIADNGIGVGAKQLENVFVIFRRLRTKPEIEGAGVGLALCKRIVQRHGGWIWAESGHGNGTAIKVKIPGAGTTESK